MVDKETLKNYRPICLLPLCQKIFERLIHNVMYENNRKQRVVLSGQNSQWTHAEPGVAEDSILGSSLVLIYINSLSDNLDKTKVIY